jgi:hypothetical protein
MASEYAKAAGFGRVLPSYILSEEWEGVTRVKSLSSSVRTATDRLRLLAPAAHVER